MRGKHPFSEEELDALRQAGAKIRTVAGDIVTTTVPTESIETVAKHPFVVSLEVSQPLHPEGAQVSWADVE